MISNNENVANEIKKLSNECVTQSKDLLSTLSFFNREMQNLQASMTNKIDLSSRSIENLKLFTSSMCNFKYQLDKEASLFTYTFSKLIGFIGLLQVNREKEDEK